MNKMERPTPSRASRPTGRDPARIMADPKFRMLVERRSGFAWSLSGAMLGIYLAFILLVAFAKPLMATTPFGGVTSLGIILGLLVIIAAFGLTGLYVQRANREFDRLQAEIKERMR